MHPRSIAVPLTALLLLAAAPPVVSLSLPVAEVVEGVPCVSDPTQTYALYLPSGFSDERRWPALIVMDPRGRSAPALEVFRPGAEEFGWMVLSSDNTLSDGPMEPNVRAINALLQEVQRRYPVDAERIYLAGFSGTAMFAWQVASQVPIAGVIAAGGRFEPGQEDRPVNVPTFGTAGTVDFNYTEMFRVHELLTRWETPQRLESFPGVHGWMPPQIARRAIAWHELQAMRSELRPRDPALVEKLLQEDLAAARELLDEGEHLAAYRRFDAIASTYEGLREVRSIRSRTTALSESAEVRRALDRERDALRYEERARAHIISAVQQLRADPPIRTPRFRIEARLATLLETAQGEGPESLAAGRALASLLALTGFYLPREYLDAGDHTRARTALEIATEIRPESPRLWLLRARAEAQLGDERGAIASLEKAVRAGFADAQTLTTEPDLAPLRDRPEFRRLLDLAAASPPDDADERREE